MSQQHQHQSRPEETPSSTTPASPRPDLGSNAGQQRQLRPEDDNNPWIPDFIEPATDWLGDQWDSWWAEDDSEQANDGATPAPAPGVTPPTPPAPAVSSWWQTYRATSGRDARQALVVAAAQRGEMAGHLSALSPEQRRGDWRFPYQQALDLYQLYATQQASGHDLGEMAQTQADYMTAEDERVAREASGGGAPTREQLEEAREQRNEQTYAPDAEESSLLWPSMPQAERDAWIARGARAKATLLAHLRAEHPDFALRDDQIIVDFEEVEAEAAVAYNDGQDHCVIGFDVVQSIERNPEFAVSTVAHELFGHNEFDRGFSVSEELFREAVARQRGVDASSVILTDDEWSRFNYFESEIASLVWEHDLYVGSDDAGQTNPLGSPASYMSTLLSNLNGQWAPDLVEPLVRGLYARFVADPDISAAAAAFFAQSCRTHLGIAL
ncbi:MAG TPA: hypothetical protein ENK18_24005 [Deltaproteobacteria bacterium]|nr:hypothetical protein [Deltaproteobacteria bacterium]